MSTEILPRALQVIGISTAFLAGGGIATLSLFDVPELRAQPASRSLPSVRWLFSRGSHIFPTAAAVSSLSFAAVALRTFALRPQPLYNIVKLSSNGSVVNGYLAAAALAIGIGPWTTFVMLPTNFELIKLNEELGGSRSEKSAQQAPGATGRSAADSVKGDDDVSELTDLSGPQAEASKSSSTEVDARTRKLLDKFNQLNIVRAVLITAGGVVGLLTALP